MSTLTVLKEIKKKKTINHLQTMFHQGVSSAFTCFLAALQVYAPEQLFKKPVVCKVIYNVPLALIFIPRKYCLSIVLFLSIKLKAIPMLLFSSNTTL